MYGVFFTSGIPSTCLYAAGHVVTGGTWHAATALLILTVVPPSLWRNLQQHCVDIVQWYYTQHYNCIASWL